MLIAIDIGNSRTSVGLFAGRRLIKELSLAHSPRPSATAIARRIRSFAGARASTACIASVVPRLTRVYARACSTLTGRRPVIVTPYNAGVAIKGYKRSQLGIDRLLAAAAAYRRHRRALIVIDAGTALTIDHVTSRGEFAGGVILPGMDSAARSLARVAARLSYVKPARSRRVMAKNTADAIRAGLFFGYGGMVERIVRRMARESRTKPLVVATGGDAALIKLACPIVKHIYPHLVLEGLCSVYQFAQAHDV